ncbi:MAG: SH3 domain-containing protein [Clostridiales bacterium]|nr:SH3 domain-containing protein [Clostridiales bacterium]
MKNITRTGTSYKNRVINRASIFAVLLLMLVFLLVRNVYRADSQWDSVTSDVREQYCLDTISWLISREMYDLAYSELLALELSPQTVTNYFNYYFANAKSTIRITTFYNAYGDAIKAAGLLPTDYTIPGASSASTETATGTGDAADTGEAAASQTSFTVEDIEPVPMWATSIVNVRDGAATDYSALGMLEQYEEVTANGLASTGWYRIEYGDGTGYVSGKFLTDEDPSNREVPVYNEETGTVDTISFEDTDPEVIDETVEAIKEEQKETVEEEPAVEEETAAETVEEPEEEAEEPEGETDGASRRKWYLLCLAGCAVTAGVAACLWFYRRKKNVAANYASHNRDDCID